MMKRRSFLAGMGAACVTSTPFGRSLAQALPAGGMIDAVEQGLRPDASTDQSMQFKAILHQASNERSAVYLRPGRYVISNIDFPSFSVVIGDPAFATLVHGGGNHFLRAASASDVHLENLVLDGNNRRLAKHIRGSMDGFQIDRFVMKNCRVMGSYGHAIALESCGGAIQDSTIAGADQAGIYAVQSMGLRIADNNVFGCGNGGILVHRWEKGNDETIVTGNRINGIRSDGGGTGQNGNGINIYRADNVMVTNNHISNCTFSAIRSNSGSDVQIVANQCLNSGETAIYSEFSFEGALVASNLVDSAANGISIANFNEGGRLAIVTGNLVRNINRPGPYPAIGPGFGWGIAAEADTVVSDNVIDTVARFGMLIGWGPYLRGVSVTDNIVRNSAVGLCVSVVEGARQTIINGNLFQNALKGAIVGYRWNERATEDLIGRTGKEYTHLEISSNSSF